MEHPQWVVKNGKKIVRWADHSPVAKVESETDATLIAAAPELLEMLESFISHFRNNDPSYYSSDLATNALELIRKVKGA